jgi:hypothetical protein
MTKREKGFMQRHGGKRACQKEAYVCAVKHAHIVICMAIVIIRFVNTILYCSSIHMKRMCQKGAYVCAVKHAYENGHKNHTTCEYIVLYCIAIHMKRTCQKEAYVCAVKHAHIVICMAIIIIRFVNILYYIVAPFI